jgi:hypothetical protein
MDWMNGQMDRYIRNEVKNENVWLYVWYELLTSGLHKYKWYALFNPKVGFPVLKQEDSANTF